MKIITKMKEMQREIEEKHNWDSNSNLSTEERERRYEELEEMMYKLYKFQEKYSKEIIEYEDDQEWKNY